LAEFVKTEKEYKKRCTDRRKRYKEEITGKMLKIYKAGDAVTFKVKVQPGAAKNEIIGVQGDVLKIKINAPPVKGKANKALIDFLAKKLGIKRSQVEILGGHTSRVKKIKMGGEGGKIEKRIHEEIASLRSQ